MKRIGKQFRNLLPRLFALIAFAFLATQVETKAAEPIKIGFGVSLTGGLAPSGKAHLLAIQIWAEEINAKGGLLGRPVQIIYYDDQTNPANVPGIYAKLIDVDKVDLLVGHATNLIVAAMPIIIDKKKLVMSLLAYASNAQLKYPRYFMSAPWGNDYAEISKNFFEVASTVQPRPKTVALVGADAEFSNNVLTGARAIASKYNLKIVYDRLYPPSTVDFTPIVRSIAAAKPDIVLVASYPVDSIGMVRAAIETGLKVSLFGGAMVGMQYASFMGQLSDKLNGLVNYHFYVPAPTLKFPGIEGFLAKYQARASGSGTDPLGFYQPPFTYAAMQVLEQAITATNSINNDLLAKHIHENEFQTIVGKIRFDEYGEWVKPRLLMVQFQNVQGAGLEQYLTGGRQIVVYPPEYRSGDLKYPFSK